MLNSEDIKNSIKNTKYKIPEQGPLEYFVHHNTIHHYEGLDFFNAVAIASKDYDANAFMPEEYYWEQYENQKISKQNIFYEIELFKIKNNITLPSHIIYRLLIQKKTDNHCIDDEKIREIRERYVHKKNSFYSTAVREDYGVEIDYIISSHIFKFFSVYFDFGSAYWSIPNRNKGMWTVFIELYQKSYTLSGKYLKVLSNNIDTYKSLSSLEALELLLEKLSISKDNLDEYLFELSCRYKGWLGLIKSLEEHPEWIKNNDVKASFEDAIAIIVLCEYSALHMLSDSLPKIPRETLSYEHSYESINYLLYEQVKNPDLKNDFIGAVKHLTDVNRKKLLHKAFEKTFYDSFFDAYSLQRKVKANTQYTYQVICCIDEREESLRRYLEVDEMCQTFGAAGHFALPIKFKGYFDKHTRALCPIVVKPEYTILEKGVIKNKGYIKSLFLWGELQWLDALNSKTMLRGIIQSFIGFFTKAVPFVLDIASPALTYKIKNYSAKHINRSISTKLRYKKNIISTGLSTEDSIRIAQTFLKSIGLVRDFSKYVFIMGHGSSSLNNPHEAAHDCGACGGGRGGPNARLMSLILNDVYIREELSKQHNIQIPSDTKFVGSYHNTCNDNITYYDQERLDDTNELKDIKQKLFNAAQLDAMERCRRFSSIVFDKSPEYYHRKVLQRAIDLRQPRPEYGHATNALCIIGPRDFTRGLFLDRRAFLVSYEQSIDKDNNILFNTLNTAVLVCAGINLEYFFSYIDNEVYGCGTKLPHNVTSLVGVMNGYQSDLQLGLPWQMVEIHEPVRLCILVICKLSVMKELLNRESNFKQLIENRWVTLSVHNSDNDKIYVFNEGEFVEYNAIEHPKSYFRIDKDIMNSSEHMSFGYIV